ncbi:MAG: hypothetical protein JJ960_12550 [Kordiimonadaceae bacterium]|nr:hypothetical protein [Kordiimonadaceae bacterium]MBO6569576.1 hypothetical protein [Kordiimonadaceae bacterium]
MTFTDEQLSAYVDGALPESEMEAITDALAQSDELTERLAALRSTDAWLKEQFSELEETPIRQETLDLIANHGAAPAAESDNVVSFQKPDHARTLAGWPAWGQAIAASVTLVVGVLTGMQIDNGSQPTEGAQQVAGLIDVSNPLYPVLQNTASMQSTSLSGGSIATPTLSFASADGTYCRELTIVDARTENRSLACQAEGGWLVRASVTTPKTPATEGFTTASANTQLIDDAVRSLMQGDSLSLEQEKNLIDMGWH